MMHGDWLDPVILTGALGDGIDKRRPEPFDIIERHFGPGHQFAYVGDNSAKDFIHPARLGWGMIQVQRPERVHIAAPAVGTIVVSDDGELFAAIDDFIRSYGATEKQTSLATPNDTRR
jgi:hypothetical protein